MMLDYTSHPTDLLKYTTAEKGQKVGIKALRAAIPAHCFKSSYRTSLYYLARDLTLAGSLTYVAVIYLPSVEPFWLQAIVWAVWGYVQGLVFTGIWVLGHECGHGAFSPSNKLNNIVGFVLHSTFMTPYFAWRSTHRRHHIYHNNMAKDHNYVPPRREQYEKRMSIWADIGLNTTHIQEISEDAPIVTLLRLILQQVMGFPWYLLTNITASNGSLATTKTPSSAFLAQSHFSPFSTLFRAEESGVILLSDVGILLSIMVLYHCGTVIGHTQMLLVYLQPYLWLNHWIVAITYLHHTHPGVPKYDEDAWTFMKGATATVDRSVGWVGKHMLHNIIDYHVIHHLFSHIPFYHAEEATKAIMPLLGDAYLSDKDRSFLYGLWESFTKCQWVEIANPDNDPFDRVLRYRHGPSPPPVFSMVD